jgi:hypothetical protein
MWRISAAGQDPENHQKRRKWNQNLKTPKPPATWFVGGFIFSFLNGMRKLGIETKAL